MKAIQTSSGVRVLNLDELIARVDLLVRLEVSGSRLKSWATHRQESGILYRMADALELTAREQGSDPNDWAVSYRDIPLTDVLSIEASRDGIGWSRDVLPVDR